MYLSFFRFDSARYDEERKSMEDDYPRTMKNWRGVPTPLKAAITWKDGERVFASISLMVQRFYRHVYIFL